MSWFKSFLKIFGSQENEDYDEVENFEQVQRENINAQMETKVTYQYPKGNFRFPLEIENDNIFKKQNESIRKAKNQPILEKKEENRNSKTTSRTQSQGIKPKIQPKIKQPFRPTEIPSPVYGFNRPPKRNNSKINMRDHSGSLGIEEEEQHLNQMAIVEEEQDREQIAIEEVQHLDEVAIVEEDHDCEQIAIEEEPHFDQVTIEEEEQDREQIAIEEEAHLDEVAIVEEKQDREQIAIEEEPHFDQVAIVKEKQNREQIELEEGQHLDEIAIVEEKQDREQIVIEAEQLHNQCAIVEEDHPLEKNDIDLNNEDLQISNGIIEPKVDEIETLRQHYDLIEEEQIITQNETSNNEKIHKGTIEEELDLNQEQEMNESNIVEIEEPITAEHIEFPENHIEDEYVELQEVVEDNEAQQANDPILYNETPARSHIPFNVIMLKKDREKLSNKQIVTDMQNAKEEIAASVNIDEEYIIEDYVFPSTNLLIPPVRDELDKEWVFSQSELLDETLLSFNVRARVVNVSQGPSVTRFEVQPEPGVKVNKITNLSDDIKLSLAAKDIRIEAPIPGKHTIGIELPNAQSRPVYISEIISSEIFQKSESPLTAALGLDISGKPVITDLRKMPHGLIAGATGSGKSVCINSILVSLLYKSTPDELKLLMIDPKMVELAPYNYIPHLVSPVITDVKAATAALKWAVEEMERRYELFAHTGVREIQRYNELAEQNRQFNQKLPFIVIVIDELADLMMMAPGDVEEAICRIAQKARACGIHLIIATQRPSVDVITGLIKANVPTRIAFSVSSQVDSRTIIDISGAEKLLGRGDMLFLENGSSKAVRLQGTYVSDEEIDQVVAHVRSERKPDYLFEQEELLKKAIIQDEEDEIFSDVCDFVLEQGAASTSLIQRSFRIGYNRAARLMEMMEQQGIISEAKGSKPRDILISKEEYDVLSGTE